MSHITPADIRAGFLIEANARHEDEGVRVVRAMQDDGELVPYENKVFRLAESYRAGMGEDGFAVAMNEVVTELMSVVAERVTATEEAVEVA